MNQQGVTYQLALLALATCFCTLMSLPAEAQDTTQVDSTEVQAADTLETEAAPGDTVDVLRNVQYVTGEQGQVPAGVARVRQRIAQIRGYQQPEASSQQPPIIVVVPQEQGAASSAASSRQTILVPGPGGRYYSLEDPSDYDLLQREELPYRVFIQEEPQADEQPAADEQPSVDEQPEAAEPSEAEEEERVEEVPEVPLLEQVEADTALVADEPEEVHPEEIAVPDLDEQPTVRQVERAILDAGLFRALGVNFEFDRAVLRPEASRTLDAVGEVMEQYPALRLEVAGHTDNVGRADYNRELSQQRAESVVSYLIEHFDIDPARLEARGYGAEQSIASNDTRTGRAMNRRVEFHVLNPDEVEEVRLIEEGDLQDEQLRQLLRQVVREELQRLQNDGS